MTNIHYHPGNWFIWFTIIAQWMLFFYHCGGHFIRKKKIIYGCESRGDYQDVYLIRYTLFECSKFQICIHVFHRSDADDLHDHPWNFVTIPLWRGYIEQTPDTYKRIYPFTIHFRKATYRHRVILPNERRAITLVFMGPYIRQWGFWEKGKWIWWKQYFKEKGC
jgi:hypothetical protein